MTAKRQPDGTVVYRGVRIVPDSTVPAGKLGRYVIDRQQRPVQFAQLAHAKAFIDQVHKLAETEAR